jgi:hypothetical protein
MSSSRVVRVTLLLLFIAAIGVLAAAPRWYPRQTARQVRAELLREIWPVVLKNCTMQRFGGPNDGGYLMCANLLGDIKTAYSYGIGPADDWGCQVSQTHGVPVHQYDCFSPPEVPCPGGQPVFHDECVGARRETIDGRLFDTIPHHILLNGDAGKTLVMKIDIEGAEVPAVMATPDHLLARVDQLAMEIHGTDRSFLAMVKKLKRNFHFVHLHFNNQACASLKFRPFPSGAFQVLLVNKRIGVLDPAAPVPTLPHPLDAPDYALGGECLLTQLPVER